jgi:hypothetical protein
MGGPGGPGNPMAFGKSKAKFQMEPNTGITFGDVAGVDEAKQDFMEVRLMTMTNPGKSVTLHPGLNLTQMLCNLCTSSRGVLFGCHGLKMTYLCRLLSS